MIYYFDTYASNVFLLAHDEHNDSDLCHTCLQDADEDNGMPVLLQTAPGGSGLAGTLDGMEAIV